MITTVEELIAALSEYKGKNIFIKDIVRDTHSYLLEIEEENGVVFLVKSVRDYPVT